MAPEGGRHKRSRCRGALGLALLFDALGLASLLTGGLLETAVSDLLIYLGGVAVFFSLPWWVFWHVGNQEVPLDELRDDVGLGWRSGDAWSLDSWRARRLALLARAFSARFSMPSTSLISVPSQAGRPRAHFAASALSTASRTGQPYDTAGGLSAPAESSSSVGTTIPQGMLGIPCTQEQGVQVSSRSLLAKKVRKLIARSETIESDHFQDQEKEKSSKSFIQQKVLNIINRSETIDSTESQDPEIPEPSRSLLPQNVLSMITCSETGRSPHSQDRGKPEASKSLLP